MKNTNNIIKIHDTHVHLDLYKEHLRENVLNPQRSDVVKNTLNIENNYVRIGPEIMKELRFFEDRGKYYSIDKVIIPAISYESNFIMRDLFPQDLFPEVFWASGIHPKTLNSESNWNKDKKRSFENWLSTDNRMVAIKTGLDFCKIKMDKNQKLNQVESLKICIDYANEYGKSLVLHVRDAAYEIIEILKKYPVETQVEIHCFTYGWEMMQLFMNSCCNIPIFFGIGPAFTKQEDWAVDLRNAIRKMDISTLFLETDAPAMSKGGLEEIPPLKCYPDCKKNTSKSLPRIVQKIAEIKGISEETVINSANQNADSFFGW